MDNRKIIHIDMDAFYASVEQRDQPEYRDRLLGAGVSNLQQTSLLYNMADCASSASTGTISGLVKFSC